jgi:hypothetical protein
MILHLKRNIGKVATVSECKLFGNCTAFKQQFNIIHPVVLYQYIIYKSVNKHNNILRYQC